MRVTPFGGMSDSNAIFGSIAEIQRPVRQALLTPSSSAKPRQRGLGWGAIAGRAACRSDGQMSGGMTL